MVDDLSPFEALKLAADRAGSQAALARICGRTPQAVTKWFQSSKRLPSEHALDVERATGVSRNALCPDIYPRGLIDGVPYAPEEPLLDVFADITIPPRQQRRDVRAADSDARFRAVDRRAGAAL